MCTYWIKIKATLISYLFGHQLRNIGYSSFHWSITHRQVCTWLNYQIKHFFKITFVTQLPSTIPLSGATAELWILEENVNKLFNILNLFIADFFPLIYKASTTKTNLLLASLSAPFQSALCWTEHLTSQSQTLHQNEAETRHHEVYRLCHVQRHLHYHLDALSITIPDNSL